MDLVVFVQVLFHIHTHSMVQFDIQLLYLYLDSCLQARNQTYQRSYAGWKREH